MNTGPDPQPRPMKTPQDRAVLALWQQGQRGQLPGAFLGRLCNVAQLVVNAPVNAVNAALTEACSLAGWLVVGDRPTALAVVGHYAEHRVGVATCKVRGVEDASKCDNLCL